MKIRKCKNEAGAQAPTTPRQGNVRQTHPIVDNCHTVVLQNTRNKHLSGLTRHSWALGSSRKKKRAATYQSIESLNPGPLHLIRLTQYYWRRESAKSKKYVVRMMPKNHPTPQKKQTFDSTEKQKEEKKMSYVDFACNFSRMPH